MEFSGIERRMQRLREQLDKSQDTMSTPQQSQVLFEEDLSKWSCRNAVWLFDRGKHPQTEGTGCKLLIPIQSISMLAWKTERIRTKSGRYWIQMATYCTLNMILNLIGNLSKGNAWLDNSSYSSLRLSAERRFIKQCWIFMKVKLQAVMVVMHIFQEGLAQFHVCSLSAIFSAELCVNYWPGDWRGISRQALTWREELAWIASNTKQMSCCSHIPNGDSMLSLP